MFTQVKARRLLGWTFISILLISTVALLQVGRTTIVSAQEGDEPDAEPTLLPPEGIEDNPNTPNEFLVSPKEESSVQSNGSSAVPIDIINIPASDTLVNSKVVLEHGQQYTLRVSGMFTWGGCDPITCPDGGPDYIRWADAGYLTDNHFHGFSDPFWSSFIYLEVNGSRLNFGDYRSDHVYNVPITGTGGRATLHIKDCSYCYPDNEGALRVEIFSGTETGGSAVPAKAFQQRGIPLTIANWGGESYGTPGYVVQPEDCGNTIEACGCRLTTWAMILDHFGAKHDFHTNPRELNNWLRANKGYSSGLYVHPRKVMEYAREETPIGPLGRGPKSPEEYHNTDLLSYLVEGCA